MFVTYIIISFILARQDTTSTAFMWFFWLVVWNSCIEREILKEFNHNFSKKSKSNFSYNEVKDTTYIHMTLYESMRLYPSVLANTKVTTSDNVLIEGMLVKKGMLVMYHPYSIGRLEALCGKDYMEYKPKRWSKMEEGTKK